MRRSQDSACGRGKLASEAIDVLDLKAADAQRGFEGAKVFEGDVAEDEGAGGGRRHGDSLCWPEPVYCSKR